MNVLGWYHHGNIGDEAYKLAFPKLFPNKEFQFSDKFNHVDILGGGNILCNEFVKKLKQPTVAISVGLDDFNIDTKNLKFVYTRDIVSLEKLKALGVPCKFMPDVTFLLQGDPIRGKQLIVEKFKDNDLYQKIIVVVVNGHLATMPLARDVAAFQKFCYDFANVLDKTSASFLFLPFGVGMPWDDRISNGWAAIKCKYWEKNYIEMNGLSVQDVLDIISACDAVISSRLHATLFSFNHGIPFIDISHHDKNKNFLRTVDMMDNSISFWNFNELDLVGQIQKALNTPKHQKADDFRKIIEDTANEIHFD